MLSSPDGICLDSDSESRLSEDNAKAPVPGDEANKRRTTGASAAEDDAGHVVGENSHRVIKFATWTKFAKYRSVNKKYTRAHPARNCQELG